MPNPFSKRDVREKKKSKFKKLKSKVPPSTKNQLQNFKFKRTEHVLNLYIPIIVSPLRAERSKQQCRKELSLRIIGYNHFISKVLYVLIKNQGLIKFCMMPSPLKQYLVIFGKKLFACWRSSRGFSVCFCTESHYAFLLSSVHKLSFQKRRTSERKKKPKPTTKTPKPFQTTNYILQKIGRLMFLKAITECSLFF